MFTPRINLLIKPIRVHNFAPSQPKYNIYSSFLTNINSNISISLTQPSQQQQPIKQHCFTTTTKKMEGAKPGATEAANQIDPKDTIFAKIVAGTIPCKKVYEDEYCLAFDDINPVAPVHVMVIPKHPVSGVGNLATEQDKKAMGHIMAKIHHIASLKGIDSYRLVVNEGVQAQQSVRWLHIHLIGGRQLAWPPG
ncbi:hypothetical protein CYY_008939 [Polysphondylium violaceum]|uniref:HIT domain-containing protein n=1 Tax=Polysphondylium violaceum TaxID=133409 RepID=A0A8J4V0W1_9MYCE|nr:hypothetical protein CYY_008939 [Polysphondylium violaceum]